jgi:hypothetical protein
VSTPRGHSAIYTQRPSDFVDYEEIPALAIPTVSKPGFVCPEEHVQLLRGYLPNVTRLVMIGWRGGERHFLEMLASGLQPGVQGVAVCGSGPAAIGTLEKLKGARVPGDYYADAGGFSDFVVNRRIEDFLPARAATT